MVLLTPIALALAPNNLETAESDEGGEIFDHRSTRNWVLVATAILLDIAIIATLITASLTCSEIGDFWKHDFANLFSGNPGIAYPIAIVGGGLWGLLILHCYFRSEESAATMEEMEQRNAPFLCFPKRKIVLYNRWWSAARQQTMA